MDIVEYINELTQKEEITNIFEGRNLELTTTNGWFRFKNKRNKEIERIKINLDPNTKRLHIQGSTIAFTLNHNKNNELYLERLITGNLDDNEIKFIMQHKINDNDNENENENENDEVIEINFTDNNNNNHSFTLKEDSLNIEKATLTIQYLISKENDLDEIKDINDIIKGKQSFNYFRFYKDENHELKRTGNPKDCADEFIELEKVCPFINNYLKTKIPFINDCAKKAAKDKINSLETKEEETMEEEPIKVYRIKKSKPFYRSNIDEIMARSNRRELKVVKPNDDNN